MNLSRYTVIAGSGDGQRLLLYNIVTQSFVSLTLERLMQEPSLLTDYDFATEHTPEEELAALQQAFAQERHNTSTLTLCIGLTYACNFACPYCYEQHHNNVAGLMDAQVEEGIVSFVETLYNQQHFRALNLQWYGGEPTLALDTIEHLSQCFIAFCTEHNVQYNAMTFSNGALLDDEVAALFERVKISEVLFTIDGPEHIHNKRRCAKDPQLNSFKLNLRAIEALQRHHITPNVISNLDHSNKDAFEQLKAQLAPYGVIPAASKLNDYAHSFGQGNFCAPDFDLFTARDYARYQLDELRKTHPDENVYKALLTPVPYFCGSQHDNYFVIDKLGDVYTCDGWMGDKDHVRFNILDAQESWKLDEITFDATTDEQCSQCNLLPVCHGNCSWHRALCDGECHPLKETLTDYLQDWEALARMRYDADELPDLIEICTTK